MATVFNCDTVQTAHMIPMIQFLLLICKVDTAACLCK